jgi:alanyl-tRNA synthetase
MLGSWSFNDYWKSEAIEYAWDLLVNIYKIDEKRLYVTYFEGNESLGIPEDVETKNIWKKYLPDERIIKCGMKDNFWEMGTCGPSTEIHYDLDQFQGQTGENVQSRDASSLINMDDPTVLEIWNIVFILYNRSDKGNAEGVLELLENRFVDTGMGLERLVSVLQEKKSNYDTDVFEELFRKITEITKGNVIYQGKVGEQDNFDYDTTCRIIIDHIRTACICLADDVIPGHNSRENVLRHIIRRAIRYSRMNLFIAEPFFWKLTDIVADTLGNYYTEIKDNREKIKYIIENEEKLIQKH